MATVHGDSAHDLIVRAIAAGATFGEFLTEYAKKNSAEDRAYVRRAKRTLHREGELEIDDNAICSGPEDGSGTHVLAWVWIDGRGR